MLGNSKTIFVFENLLINIKTSRAQILKAATEYIRFMRSKNTDYQKDIDVLKKQNTDIESQSKGN